MFDTITTTAIGVKIKSTYICFVWRYRILFYLQNQPIRMVLYDLKIILSHQMCLSDTV